MSDPILEMKPYELAYGCSDSIHEDDIAYLINSDGNIEMVSHIEDKEGMITLNLLNAAQDMYRILVLLSDGKTMTSLTMIDKVLNKARGII